MRQKVHYDFTQSASAPSKTPSECIVRQKVHYDSGCPKLSTFVSVSECTARQKAHDDGLWRLIAVTMLNCRSAPRAIRCLAALGCPQCRCPRAGLTRPARDDPGRWELTATGPPTGRRDLPVLLRRDGMPDTWAVSAGADVQRNSSDPQCSDTEAQEQ